MQSRVLGYRTVAEVCDGSHETLWIALQRMIMYCRMKINHDKLCLSRNCYVTCNVHFM